MSGYAIADFHISFTDFGQEKTAYILQLLIHQLNAILF